MPRTPGAINGGGFEREGAENILANGEGPGARPGRSGGEIEGPRLALQVWRSSLVRIATFSLSGLWSVQGVGIKPTMGQAHSIGGREMNRTQERARLDAMSAARMHLPPWVALAHGPGPSTLRFKLRRLGFDLDRPEVQALLELVDHREAQRMLQRQPVSTRYAAVVRSLKRREPWS